MRKDGISFMMYAFLTLDDKTEIVHSEMHSDGSVKVYMERLDEKAGFRFKGENICSLLSNRSRV